MSDTQRGNAGPDEHAAFPITPELDRAISLALAAWYAFGAQQGRDAEKIIARQAQYELRQAIRAAVAAQSCGAAGCRWIAPLEGRANDVE